MYCYLKRPPLSRIFRKSDRIMPDIVIRVDVKTPITYYPLPATRYPRADNKLAPKYLYTNRAVSPILQEQ